MVEQEELILKISKSGPNLMAWIPANKQSNFSRGDIVKVILLEKANIINEKTIKAEIQRFLKSPNGSKLKGSIMGFPVEIPIVKFLRDMPRDKAEKILYEALLK